MTEDTECFACGVVIRSTATFLANRRSDKATFYCQNGHANGFAGEADAKKAERLERVTRDLARQADNLAAERLVLLEQVKKFKAEKRAARRAERKP